MTDTITVQIETWRQTLVAPHAFPEKVELLKTETVELLRQKCLGLDYWYKPAVMFTPIERELRRLGYLPYIAPDVNQWFHIVKTAQQATEDL